MIDSITNLAITIDEETLRRESTADLYQRHNVTSTHTQIHTHTKHKDN